MRSKVELFGTSNVYTNFRRSCTFTFDLYLSNRLTMTKVKIALPPHIHVTCNSTVVADTEFSRV